MKNALDHFRPFIYPLLTKKTPKFKELFTNVYVCKIEIKYRPFFLKSCIFKFIVLSYKHIYNVKKKIDFLDTYTKKDN